MTWVKVCGLTRRADVEAAEKAGADAVGFVIFPESRRYVAPEEAAELGAGIAALRVVVAVHLGPEELLAAAAVSAADGVQPSGRHAAEAAAAAVAAGYLVLRPVAVADQVDLSAVPDAQIPLLDSVRGNAYGGTGIAFDWSLASGLDRRFVLAGGLRPETVAEAVRITRPWGVDASSGLESAPGKKDPDKVRAFIEGAKLP